jgi:hypothetical protein
MTEWEPCSLGHDEPNRMRYETTINEPGKESQPIVCCQDCGVAIYEREAKKLPTEATNKELVAQLQRQLPAKEVEIPKPQRIPDPPSVERSIGLDPPGYRR